ncbi:MAG: hypothetical protein FJ276_28100 [Planctomycetes bacterium]|nr:hypothetical protein [Planctomycetota bacterium]
MTIVVQDASTLINLLWSGLLTVAAEALELRILTTDLVAAEIREPRAEFEAAVRNQWVEVRDLSGDALLALVEERQRATGLSIQDVSVVALARAEVCPLFSSDARVRAYADKCDVIVYGELWILDRLVDRGALTPGEAAGKLQTMLRHAARLPRKEVEIRMDRWNTETR